MFRQWRQLFSERLFSELILWHEGKKYKMGRYLHHGKLKRLKITTVFPHKYMSTNLSAKSKWKVNMVGCKNQLAIVFFMPHADSL